METRLCMESWSRGGRWRRNQGWTLINGDGSPWYVSTRHGLTDAVIAPWTRGKGGEGEGEGVPRGRKMTRRQVWNRTGEC